MSTVKIVRERRAVLAHLAPYRLRFAALVPFAFVGAVGEAGSLLMLGLLVSNVTSSDAGGETVTAIAGRSIAFSAGKLLILGLLALALRTFGQLMTAWLATRISSTYESTQRGAITSGFHAASWATQSRERVGQMQDIITTDIELGRVAVDAAGTGLGYLCGLIMLVGASTLVSPLTSAAILASAVLFFALTRPFFVEARKFSARRAEANASWAGEVHQSLALAKEFRVFDASGRGSERLRVRARKMQHLRQWGEFHMKAGPLTYQNLVILMALLGLAALASRDSDSAPGIVGAALLLIRAASYSQGVQGAYQRMSELQPFLDRVAAKRMEFDQTHDLKQGEHLAQVNELALQDLSFAYPGGSPVLKSLSARIDHGEVIGLIGESGAGKSTLLELLLRLRTPTDGCILVNGQPAETYSIASWYERFSFVPQEPLLLDSSIADNIRFFRDELPDTAVAEAARDAHIDVDAQTLPLGLDTLAGEGGRELSGGQRQRICIARALAGNPDVLLFDEPTSALDVHSEALIRKTMASLRGRVTVFIVAHRLSTLDICDRIMVMKDGHIQAFSSHADLQSTSSYYRDARRLSGLS